MRSRDTSNKKLRLCRLDKAGAHVIIKIERDAATAVRTLVKLSIDF